MSVVSVVSECDPLRGSNYRGESLIRVVDRVRDGRPPWDRPTRPRKKGETKTKTSRR